MARILWTEKYRPATIEGYVWKDTHQKEQVEAWIKDGAIPHLLFSGHPGTGKTTLAKILLNTLNVPSTDILSINASQENNVDTVRTKIVNFVQTLAFGDLKYVLLDEADMMSPAAQGILRNLMEQYQDNARFILTCNYPNKIIPAIKSRCQAYHFEKLNMDEFQARAIEILINEGVDINENNASILDTYVKATYPDLRKCINLLQQNCVNGQLKAPSENESGTSDIMIKMVEMFKSGKIVEARKLLSGNMRPEEFESIFRFMYDNLDLWGATNDEKEAAILVIAKGARNNSLVADPEINMAATLVELKHIRK